MHTRELSGDVSLRARLFQCQCTNSWTGAVSHIFIDLRDERGSLYKSLPGSKLFDTDVIPWKIILKKLDLEMLHITQRT